MASHGVAMIPGSGPTGGVNIPSPELVDPMSESRRARRLENREKDLTLTWRQWVRQRYARYWYLLGCLLLNMVIVGTILQVFSASPIVAWQYALAIVVVIALLYPEYLGYHRLWPPLPME